MADVEKRLTMLQWMLGGLAAAFLTLAVAVVPWAFVVQSDLSAIKTTLAASAGREIPPAWFKADVEGNTQRLDTLEARVRELEKDAHK